MVSMEIKTGGLKVSSNSLNIENIQNTEKKYVSFYSRVYFKKYLCMDLDHVGNESAEKCPFIFCK